MNSIAQVQKKQNLSPTIHNSKAPRDDKRLQYQKNMLMVAQQISPSENSLRDEDQRSTDQIQPQRNTQRKTTQDYVDLPKINFSLQQLSGKQRKPSQVNIAVPQFGEEEDHPASNSRATPTDLQQNDRSYDSIDEQKIAQGGWNINNIRIIPSKNNNYLEQDYTLPNKTPPTRNRTRRPSREIDLQRERRERERNMQMVSNFLSGKASVIWLFILGPEVTPSEIEIVRKIYRQYVQKQYEVPICSSYTQACIFLRLQNCFFKVVVDLASSPQLLEESAQNKSIVAIYLYNRHSIYGINRAFQTKRHTRKVKGVFNSLQEAARQAADQLQNQTKFVRVGNELQSERNKLRFPGFLSLTAADTTEVTNYRLCLYGALKLNDRKQKETYLKEFTDMVELRYKDSDKQLAHLTQYKLIDHLVPNNEHKYKQILQFYVKQTFYYPITNSILRLSRSPEEFRPCTIPFNQTYHAIKHYYTRARQQSSPKNMTVYRGAKFKATDIKALQVGNYLELLGFTSTSLQRAEAQKFMDSDSYLLEIHIQSGADTEKQMAYDHGYVQINRFALAANAFQKEEEVLINALNVFLVTSIDLQSAIRKITLQYGAILPLLRTNNNQLSPHDRAVVQNYLYCSGVYEQIEDDGDVLRLAHQHDRCVAYYQTKVDNGQSGFRLHGKLANAHFQIGDLDQAYTNALRSLERLEEESRDNEEIKKTVHQLQQNGDVFNSSEDYIHYEKCIDACLKRMKEDWFETAKLTKQKAEKKFKAGDLYGCSQDLKQSRDIIEEQRNSFQKRKKQLNKRYYIRSLCCACSRTASSQLQQQHQLQLLKIQEDQLQFERRKDQILMLSIEIQNLQKELAEYRGDVEKYRHSAKQAQQHFAQMTKIQNANPIEQAKQQVLAASIIDKYAHSAQYESTIEQAIKKLKKHDPLHKDIGTYSNILGTHRQAIIKWKVQLAPLSVPQHLPPSNADPQHNNDPNMSGYIPIEDNYTINIREPQKFNYQQHQALRVKCKETLSEAAQNIAYHNGNEHPDYISVCNKLIEVDYDYSLLQQSQKTAFSTKQFKLIYFHSQGAKCYLLLAKISLAKGELKSAFSHIEQSLQILRTTLLKVDNKQYNAILVHHPLYTEINLHRAKIFNRQLKHDLALRQLQILKKIAEIQSDKHLHPSLLASVHQQQAQVQLCMGETDDFQDMLLQAISIRTTQMGQYNIPNAITFSNLFKFLLQLNDQNTAIQYHMKATQIFLRFPPDHPNSWVIHLSNALIYHQQKDYPKTIDQMEYCLKVTTHRYSQNHIILLKIKYQYAKLLRNMALNDRSLELLKSLQTYIEKCLKDKENAGQKIQKETDDEKFVLLKQIYVQMRDIYQDLHKQLGEADLNSLIQVEKCNSNLKEMEQTLTQATQSKIPTTPKLQNISKSRVKNSSNS